MTRVPRAVLALFCAIPLLLPAANAHTRLAIPSYAAPGSQQWRTWQALGPQALGIMIVNLKNGDEVGFSAPTAAAVKSAQDAGITVLGYVHTGYGKREPQEVRAKIDAVFKNYGVNGIFLDETPAECNEANKWAGMQVRYYQGLADYIHQKGAKSVVVLNPGLTPTEDCWMRFTDILVTFEQATLANYQHKFEDRTWTQKYAPERFWHLIYSVPSAAEMKVAIALARERRAGWLYVTSDGPDGNPWNDVPPYLAEEASAWSGQAVPLTATNSPAAMGESQAPKRVSIKWRAPQKAKSQILLDIDQKRSTGYHGPELNIGADVVIEVPGDGSANVMSYAGTGTDWKWTPIAAHAILNSPEPGVNIVEFDATPLGSANLVKVQFRRLADDWSPVFTSDVVRWTVTPK